MCGAAGRPWSPRFILRISQLELLAFYAHFVWAISIFVPEGRDLRDSYGWTPHTPHSLHPSKHVYLHSLLCCTYRLSALITLPVYSSPSLKTKPQLYHFYAPLT